jgi:bacterioferritin-associated ferredoxin
MYVCICNYVTDREIHEAVELGVCSMGELRDCLGVSTGCGKCADCAKDVLQEALSLQMAIEPLAA